jgi:hypothetical protein
VRPSLPAPIVGLTTKNNENSIWNRQNIHREAPAETPRPTLLTRRALRSTTYALRPPRLRCRLPIDNRATLPSLVFAFTAATAVARPPTASCLLRVVSNGAPQLVHPPAPPAAGIR